MSRTLNIIIVVLAVIAVVVMFVSSGEPVVFFLRGTPAERLLIALGHANVIAFNLAIGYLMSAFFWLLVVYLPERNRSRVIKENLSRRYQDFKESVLQILLWNCTTIDNCVAPAELCDHNKFKEYFEKNNRRRWYKAMNGLEGNAEHMGELLMELEIFASEIAYVLNNTNIQDARVYRSFKILKENIYRFNHSPFYTSEQVKLVGRFLWGVLARWDFFDGQHEDDIIQTIIDKI